MRVYLVLLSLFSCCTSHQGQPVVMPFRAIVAGHEVIFPLLLGQILERKSTYYVTDGQYRDTTQVDQLGWYYDWHNVINDTTNHWKAPNSTPLYGMSITMKGKAGQIDSVRKVIEQEFGMPMKALKLSYVDTEQEGLFFNPMPVYVCYPGGGVQISIRLASCWKGDYPYRCGRLQSTDPPMSDNPENSLRITVSFGLKPDEAERFASGSGQIWKDVD